MRLVNLVKDNMDKMIELGTVSSRGQIAIPADIRRRLGLDDGKKIMFVVEGDTIMIKKVDIEKTWEEVTRPLREAAKKSGLKEEDVPDMIHRMRKKRHESHTGH
jgi:AbrB family looped-hinge helix DNA binding protein